LDALGPEIFRYGHGSFHCIGRSLKIGVSDTLYKTRSFLVDIATYAHNVFSHILLFSFLDFEAEFVCALPDILNIYVSKN
jgi:hypothetical protein